MTRSNAFFHIAGCVVAGEPDPVAIDEVLDWARRYGATVVSHDERLATFVRFDADGGQLVLFGCRAAMARRPPNLRFGYASLVKEVDADGQPRAAERGLTQAQDLAAAAQPGQVLLSSQLGSLLQVAEVEPHQRLRSLRLPLADGRTGSAYLVEPLRGAVAASE
jgi:hypothetical protein